MLHVCEKNCPPQFLLALALAVNLKIIRTIAAGGKEWAKEMFNFITSHFEGEIVFSPI